MSLDSIIQFRDYLNEVIEMDNVNHPTTINSLKLFIENYYKSRKIPENNYFDYNAFINDTESEDNSDDDSDSNDDQNNEHCCNYDDGEECDHCTYYNDGYTDNSSENFMDAIFDKDTYKIYQDNNLLVDNYNNWYQNMTHF
uniref:Uncharacterized protein n=1 Tax=Megaviridae environmental sample TaxID=1737588 RepID=A0A5J6VKJ6_9VIRU|nr:MAG: hypothetical protein [Megaviridae environmental sample]